MGKAGRQGLSEAEIRDAISQLQDDNETPSPAKIRGILGSGSYSTIGAVLTRWREEQQQAARTEVPDPSPRIQRLFGQLWSEAIKVANDYHKSERTGFDTERTTWEDAKGEMSAEISRLEAAVDQIQEKLDTAAAALELARTDLIERDRQLAAAMTRADTLDREVSHTRVERKRWEQSLVELSERAAKAEALLKPDYPRRDATAK